MSDQSVARFGTFTGVFTPTILTILGVIVYVRVGWFVGNAGLGGVLMILGPGMMITVCTGLSLSFIATSTSPRRSRIRQTQAFLGTLCELVRLPASVERRVAGDLEHAVRSSRSLTSPSSGSSGIAPIWSGPWRWSRSAAAPVCSCWTLAMSPHVRKVTQCSASSSS